MDPTPEDEEAATLLCFAEDIAAVCAKYGYVLEAYTDGDYGMLGPPAIAIVRQSDAPCLRTLLVFSDRELRFEPELRDPEDVVAQVKMPETAHQKIQANARVNRIREQGTTKGIDP